MVELFPKVAFLFIQCVKTSTPKLNQKIKIRYYKLYYY